MRPSVAVYSVEMGNRNAMTPCLVEELVERTHSLIDAALENVRVATDLCEISRDLRYNNADLRDFLRENRLIARSRQERWMEERLG